MGRPKAQWRADARGLHLDRDAHFAARAERRTHQRSALDRARITEMAAHIDKPTFTRADMVELIGAQLPIDAPGDPGALIEQIVDEVGVRISAPREAHHREGHEKFTLEAIIAEEERILEMADESDNRARLDLRDRRPRRPVRRSGTRHPQHRGVTVSGAAPAGARRCGQDPLPQGAARRRAPGPQRRPGPRPDRQGRRRGNVRGRR